MTEFHLRIRILQEISNPGKTLFFKNVTESVAEEARRLYEEEGIRIIIAVGHAGFEADIIIAKLPYIDLVVGGHTNTFLYNGRVNGPVFEIRVKS